MYISSKKQKDLEDSLLTKIRGPGGEDGDKHTKVAYSVQPNPTTPRASTMAPPPTGPPAAPAIDLAPDDPIAMATSLCCPNECEELVRLPIHRGLMITIGTDDDDDDNKNNNNDDDGNCRRDARVRLDLHPQEDASLSKFHPNIYVPRAMLERPELLVKYGGGGEELGDDMERLLH